MRAQEPAPKAKVYIMLQSHERQANREKALVLTNILLFLDEC